MKPDRVLLSGASGMIGSALLEALFLQSIAAVRLVRGKGDAGRGLVTWNPHASSPDQCLPSIPPSLRELDAAIYLSGASVASQRWTPTYRRELRESRVLTTRALCDLLNRLDRPPRVLVCASAVGIYGNRGDEILDESSKPGQGFLADLCQEWE